MDTLVMVGQFILSLSILIVLHECGHFFPAKWFNTKVEKFYLFFDPYFSLWKTKIGETEYGIGWLPLGGYVKIAGMIDESFDKEQMKGPPQDWEFRSKPAWQRLIIMIGGVTVNFILGFFLFAMALWYWGEEYFPAENVKYGIAVDSLGYEMGLRDGDHIVSIGDKAFDKFSPGFFSSEIIINSASETTVVRDGRRIDIPIDKKYIGILSNQANQKKPLFGYKFPTKVKEVAENSSAAVAGIKADDEFLNINGLPAAYHHLYTRSAQQLRGQPVTITLLRNNRDTLNLQADLGEDGTLGFYAYTPLDFFDSATETYTLGSAIPAGINKGTEFLTSQIKAFGQIFKGRIKAKDSLGSFISIGKMYGTTWDWQRFWNMTAMLSILLAFINLLPIPALDGGHVMFLMWEVITGVKPSDKVLEYSTMAGFFLLVILMIYAIGLDISRLF